MHVIRRGYQCGKLKQVEIFERYIYMQSGKTLLATKKTSQIQLQNKKYNNKTCNRLYKEENER